MEVQRDEYTLQRVQQNVWTGYFPMQRDTGSVEGLKNKWEVIHYHEEFHRSMYDKKQN